MYITAQSCRLRNDLYCVEWDVKLYYTIPLFCAVIFVCECSELCVKWEEVSYIDSNSSEVLYNNCLSLRQYLAASPYNQDLT